MLSVYVRVELSVWRRVTTAPTTTADRPAGRGHPLVLHRLSVDVEQRARSSCSTTTATADNPVVTMTLQAIKYENGTLEVLDQLLLPKESKYIPILGVEDGWKVINKMQVRGALHLRSPTPRGRRSDTSSSPPLHAAGRVFRFRTHSATTMWANLGSTRRVCDAYLTANVASVSKVSTDVLHNDRPTYHFLVTCYPKFFTNNQCQHTVCLRIC